MNQRYARIVASAASQMAKHRWAVKRRRAVKFSFDEKLRRWIAECLKPARGRAKKRRTA